MEIELEENIRRQDLTWQERSQATSQLFELRRLQAEKAKVPAPGTSQLAAELYPDYHPKAANEAIRRELVLARNLKDPEVAKASSAEEGLKIVKRKEEIARTTALGKEVGRTFNASIHKLIQGNCLEVMLTFDPLMFDVILTDPPYGIDAQSFNDSGGKAASVGHVYDDSHANWQVLIKKFLDLSFKVAKPQAHFYCFCDIDRFEELRYSAKAAGWKVFRTPLVWHNPSSQRAPWPSSGPHRQYQLCLYAIKGERPILKSSSDVVTYASDVNVNWAAQKPVGLFADLLQRSCRAGDRVLDPFAGSGTIFPAAHGLKIEAWGVEQDETAYGIAVKRLGLLK
jgi:site-specific DNA-methyltransferase (adenine-specific)